MEPITVNYSLLLKIQAIPGKTEEFKTAENGAKKVNNLLEPLEYPEILIPCDDQQRQLFDIEFTVNSHLLVESSFVYEQLEVYCIEQSYSQNEQTRKISPIMQVDAGAKGLSAITTGSDRIYLGYKGSKMSSCVQIQVWNFEYEKLAAIELELKENIVTEMALCHDEKLLVCAHRQGFVTVISTESEQALYTNTPFSELQEKIESFTNVKSLGLDKNTGLEKLVFASTEGLFVALLSQTGEFSVVKNVFLQGMRVTNVERIHGNELLCSVNDKQNISKIMTVDVEDNMEEIIHDHEKDLYAFDLVRCPMDLDENYFILHLSDGLHLIDPVNDRIYRLRIDQNKSQGVCRSIATALIDDKDPEKGFWLANIDNSDPFQPCVKIYDFDKDFIDGLRHVSDQVKQGKSDSKAK